MGLERFLFEGAKGFGISLSPQQLSLFMAYLEALQQWNRVHRLTAISDPREIIIKHFLDSLTPVKILPSLENMTLLDVGSGAGFPGIPLKILYPGIKLFLLDASEKKASFLHYLIGLLKLKNVRVLNKRLKSMGQEKQYVGRFDLVVTRGVGKVLNLLQFCKVLLKPNGKVLVFRGDKTNLKTEIRSPIKKVVVKIPCSSEIRTLWLI